jgi:hypothetical protein
MLSSRNAWRIGTIRAAQRLLQPLPRPSSSATTLKTSVDDIRRDPPRLIFAEQLGRPASAQKKEPRRDFSPGLYSQRCRVCVPSPPISRGQAIHLPQPG